MSDDWKIYRLGQITDWFSGGTPRKNIDRYWNGDIPWISASSMSNNRISTSDMKITNEGLKSGSKLANKDDILLLVRGSILHQKIPVGIVMNEVSYNQDVKRIKVKDNLNPWFLLYWFIGNEKTLLRKVDVTGIGAGKFDTDFLQNYPISLPSLKEQKIIVDIVKSLDDKIYLNNQINQTLESIAQAMFKSWFIDFEPVRAKIAAKQEGKNSELAAMCAISGTSEAEIEQMAEENLAELRATAALFPDELVESELGEVPKGWSVSKVDDILKRIKIKKRFKKNDVNEFGQTFVLEQGSNIILGFHDNEGSISASKEEPAFIFGDHTCITRLMLSNFDVSENVIAVKGKERNSYWTYYAIKDLQKFQEYRRHWMELTSKQVVVADVRLTDYFAKKVKILHEDIEYSLRENLVLMNLRNTLLPKLLSGEISVSSFQEDTND
ncbi:restriction endonuclease subunit S [Acinetobacter baumannii]|uniref:restriction endonuclease subunit S n=1 Tax=Acinetobacter baumannii TaxID=470 RepID=UPI0021C9E4F0|nr:restriction endonuclease subunit S [Acinetobacter baumannii]MCW1880871.1 restriction endonuclease subunit S [Acinetobacter baumannii]MDR9530049.1 restriction endonuclease subunit S [Acinetobacter baumannii]UUG52573.1 restriction endonuclease subunit S [Acinetobacter baumannii]